MILLQENGKFMGRPRFYVQECGLLNLNFLGIFDIIKYKIGKEDLIMQEYIATVQIEIMGKEITLPIPYLEEEYDEEVLYDIAVELIMELIRPISYTIKPMKSEVFYE